MTSGWIKSLQCKSKALDDVLHRHHHYSHSCRNSVQSLKDIVETNKKPKPNNKNPNPSKQPGPDPPFKRPVSRKHEPCSNPQPSVRTRPTGAEPLFSSLTELPQGHPSRNVVEIIFHTSWGEKHFSGRVEMVLKVHNLARTVTRFEEYRETVKTRANLAAAGDGGEDHARRVADGNEVMRFFCLGEASNGGAWGTGGCSWAFQGGKRSGVCTFPGSGAAHESAGGGRGRRAMLVCRVIAGRVCKQLKYESLMRIGYDSVSGENGELFVFDTRALLPCFLIIYKL